MICAEGYVFELERRGYLQAGAFVPEVVLEHPEVGHATPSRLRPRGLGRRRGAHLLRASREAARHRPRAGPRADQPARARDRQGGRARRPARSSPATSATPTSTIPPTPASHKAVRAMFEEQVGWAVDAGVDFVIGETFSLRAGSADRARRGQARRAGRGDHARDAQGRRHARGLDASPTPASASPMPAPTSSASTAFAARRR